jgi:hypothetical protein
MTTTRQLANDFLHLPYHVQLEIADKMKFDCENEDRARTRENDFPQTLFRYAKKKDLVLLLADLTAKAKRIQNQ